MIYDPEILVSIRHGKILRYCSKGMREFFKSIDVDWMEFVKVGIPAKVILESKNAMAIKMIKVAMEELNV